MQHNITSFMYARVDIVTPGQSPAYLCDKNLKKCWHFHIMDFKLFCGTYKSYRNVILGVE